MKKEYDFSRGERGKFYRPDAELSIPVYLEADVAKVLRERAERTDATVGALVNQYLRREIRPATGARGPKVR